MLPVCWVVREGDDGHDELRYSMRSVAANLPHDRVAIAGYKPPWVADVVEHVPTEQRSKAKQRNIRTNVRAACRRWDRWILCWDDVFVMQPMDELPIMNVGTVEERVERLVEFHGKLNSFARSIRRAGELLERYGHVDPLCFDSVHVPQIIDSKAMLRACEMAEQHGTSRILTLHGNIAGHIGVKVVNAKAREDWRDRLIISTNDKRFARTEVGDHIRARFPEPCRYEQEPA